MNALESRFLTIGPASGDHLRLEVLELVPAGQEGAGDFHASVSVSCDGFTATDRGCWVLRSVFDEFLLALRRFEASRVGCATLESMSLGDLILTIASDRPTQWPVVTGTIAGRYLGPAHAYRGQLNFAFTLDSSFVFQLLHDFEHLLSDRNHA